MKCQRFAKLLRRGRVCGRFYACFLAENGGDVQGRHQLSVTLASATRLHVAPIASTAVSRPTSEPEDFLRPKTLAAKTVAPLGAHMLLCQARRQRRAIAACWVV